MGYVTDNPRELQCRERSQCMDKLSLE